MWRCWQTNSNRSPQGQYGCPLCDAKVAPLCKSGGAVLLENGSGGEIAFGVKMVGDGGVDGGELLQTSHAPELEHRPLRWCQTNSNSSLQGQDGCPLCR